MGLNKGCVLFCHEYISVIDILWYQLRWRTQTFEARIRHGLNLVPTYLTTLDEDLKHLNVLVRKVIYSFRPGGWTSPFISNRDPYDSRTLSFIRTKSFFISTSIWADRWIWISLQAEFFHDSNIGQWTTEFYQGVNHDSPTSVTCVFQQYWIGYTLCAVHSRSKNALNMSLLWIWTRLWRVKNPIAVWSRTCV